MSRRAAVGWSSFRCDGTFLWTHAILPSCNLTANLRRLSGAGLQTLVGGDITLFTELCEKTRQDSFAMMTLHAAQLGANAIIAFRYDANELMNGVTEVLAYGTAVVVERQ